MTSEEMERTIEFLLQQQASFQESLMRFEQQAEADRKEMRDAVSGLTNNMNGLATQAEEDRQAIREAFNKFDTDITRLVGIVENTRDFAQDVARIAVATEKRLTKLDERVDGHEKPQSE